MYRGESSRAASAGAKRYLTCGQMARANCVTEKTLRFYQKKGLLAPEHVDDETGFRYYDIAQSTKLDLITQLRTIGLSLDEICELADERDMDKLHASLDGQLRALAARRQELEHAERLAAELLHDCDMYQNPTLVNEIILEFMAPRHRLEFAIPPLDELVRGVGDFSGSDQWEWLVRHVKQVIVERGWPLSLFRDVGYIAARDRLHCDDLWANRAFVAVDASFGECFEEAVPFPEGLHLVMYVNQGFSDEGDAIDRERFERMLDYAEAKRLEVAADPYAESLCRFPRLFNQSMETLTRYCMPVKKRAAAFPKGSQ